MLTKRQESFALLLFQGKPQREAYILAGYSDKMSPSTIDEDASRLAHSSKVLARVNELRAAVASPAIGTVEERMKRLTEIYRANLTDFVDKDGNIELKPSGALAEVVIEDWKGGKEERASSQTKRVKLRDPVSAIQEHNKMEHIYETGATRDVNVVFVIGKGYQSNGVETQHNAKLGVIDGEVVERVGEEKGGA